MSHAQERAYWDADSHLMPDASFPAWHVEAKHRDALWIGGGAGGGEAPFPCEDVGWLVEQSGEELFLFSSDDPHPEGGRNPIGRFEASFETAGTPASGRERFYEGNFAALMRLEA